jgi:hypothetical protein
MSFINDFVAYVFTPFPGKNFSYYTAVIVLIIILIGGSVLIRLYGRKNKDDKAFKKVVRPYKSKLDLLSAFLIIYLLCRYFGIPLLSMRFLLYILLAVTVITICLLIKKYIKDYPKLKKHRAEQLEKNKYIPRKKKK